MNDFQRLRKDCEGGEVIDDIALLVATKDSQRSAPNVQLLHGHVLPAPAYRSQTLHLQPNALIAADRVVPLTVG